MISEWVVVTRSWNCFNPCCRMFSAFPVNYASNSFNHHAIGPDQMQTSCIDNHLSAGGMGALSHVTWHQCGHPVTRPGHVPRVSSRVSTIHKPHQMARHTLRHSPFNPHLATSKVFDIKLVDDVTKVETQVPLSNVWSLMELGISGLNAVYCNILWFSIKLPGSSRRFIGDHNCVTPHCFPQIESEEQFGLTSDQDRPAWILDISSLIMQSSHTRSRLSLLLLRLIDTVKILLTPLKFILVTSKTGIISRKLLLQHFKIPLAYSLHHLCHCICQITPSWESKINFKQCCLHIFKQVSF